MIERPLAMVSVDFWNTIALVTTSSGRSLKARQRRIWRRAIEGAGLSPARSRRWARALDRWCAAGERRGRAPSLGRQALWLSKRIGARLPPRKIADAMDEAALRAAVSPAPGARRAIAGLRAAGLRTALVSNLIEQTPRAVERLLERWSMDRLWDDRFYSCEHAYSKPDPRAIGEVLRRLGVAPGEAVHIGDHRVYDGWGARRAGVAFLRFVPGTAADVPDRGPARGRRIAPVVRSWRQVTPRLLQRAISAAAPSRERRSGTG